MFTPSSSLMTPAPAPASPLFSVVASVVAIGLLAALPGPAGALDNGLARTPPMGWLSWERFLCNTDCAAYPDDCISSRLYMAMADRLVADGYSKLGYQYVNVDDCWSELERAAGSGHLLANASRFPEGIGALAKYVHDKQLKLGLYGDCGTATCAGYPGQLKSEHHLADNYFELDARRLAEWRVDSFKFDGCNLAPAKAESVCPHMASALAATGRPVLLTCEWPFYMLREMYNGNASVKLMPNFELAASSCNAWRFYEDVEDSWLSILNIVDFSVRLQSLIVKHHGPGHWFDPDQLVVGNFALSLDQARAQMALWSVWSAPLFMSNDLRAIEPEMRDVLQNQNLIAVDQDQLGVWGLMVAQSADARHQAFAKPVEPIKAGCPSFVIVYLNRDALGNSRDISFKTRDLLLQLPLELAAQRYKDLYPRDEAAAAPSDSQRRQRPGGEFEAGECRRLLELAMTKRQDPKAKGLLNVPLNGAPSASLEQRELYFNTVDLFGDERLSKLALDADLTLRVNPSGVRAVKLIQLD